MSNMRVYSYWCEPAAPEDSQQLRDQLTLAYRYRKQLVGIENVARAAQRALDRRFPPVAALLDEIEAVLKLEDADARTEQLPPLRAQLSAARKVARATDEWKDALKKIHDDRSASVRAARGEISSLGLAWGTYLIVEEAAEQSSRTTPIWEDVKAFIPPGHGAIAVQIQSTRPVSCDEVVGGNDTRVRVGTVLYGLGHRTDGHRQPNPPGVRNKGGGGAPRIRELALRTGSNGREPIWTRFHLLMHRPLPPGQVKWIRVHQVRIGVRYRWSAQFVVDLADIPLATRDAAPAIAVGVDLGWRKLEGGYRVAMAVGSDGVVNELVIPAEVIQRQSKSDDLRSIRDKRRDELRVRLLGFRDAIDDVWFLDDTSALHLWLRISHFARLHHEWASNRFEGDAAMFDELGAWLAQDRHLIDWERFNIRRMKHQIEGHYDRFAHELCRGYAKVGLEDMDLTKLRDAGAQDGMPWMTDVANARGSLLGLGFLRERIRKVATKFGVEVVDVDPAYTTQRCATCGTLREQSADLLITCPSCGTQEDQDITGAKNILRATLEVDAAPRDAKKKQLRSRRTRKKVVVTEVADG